MDLRVYEVLFQFNQGLDQALRSLDILEKLELESPELHQQSPQSI